jgi:biopolymer transport protein ExbD/biopolymer transport protein TolR
VKTTGKKPSLVPITRPAARASVLPEINVTPLVDVVLVLLIVFMVIAPQLEHGERVELPSVTKPDDAQKSASVDPVTVTLSSSGSLYVERELVSAETLDQKLAEVHAIAPERKVVLKGDSTVPYGKVRDVFARVQKVGFPGCALLVEKKEKG